VRAGLLSEPSVVALLREKFIPCLLSARNTAECMVDPRDAALLASYARASSERFVGGEREVFVLPDGTMQDVFTSLRATEKADHMTAAGRRAEIATAKFRAHAERALRSWGGVLPEDWAGYWDGSAPGVAAIAAATPQWPTPTAGRQAFRVFVRNSFRMYDDLHGCELVGLDDAVVAALGEELRDVGAEARLDAHAFRALVRAMAPRGNVAPRLADGSIDGELVLRVARCDGDVVTGVVTGRFAFAPKTLDEAGRRHSAACLFESKGALRGEFTFDRASGAFRSLRCVATDVDYRWISRSPGFADLPTWFAPRHRIAFEWVK
jgi:hypothetical protein